VFPEEGCKYCPGLLFSKEIPSGDKTGAPEVTSASSRAKRENSDEPSVSKGMKQQSCPSGEVRKQEKKISRMGKVQLII